MPYDLLLRGGRVIDPAAGIDGKRDIAFSNGRVMAVEPEIPAENARQVVDATDCLVTPGLIDLHSHVYWGGTPLGVCADQLAPRSGTTTFVDAGSAGAGNFLGFRRHVIERSRARILAFVNISFPGIFGFSSRIMVGECGDLRLLDPREAVAAIRDNRDLVVGVKVRSGRIAGGNSGIAPVEMAVEAADRAQLPLMAHIDEPPPGRLEVLRCMRPGDVLTHCYRPFPNAAIDGAGRIRADMLAARERGIIFDIGHGMGSFDFSVARTMIAEGFAPDVISSDLHLFCADGPAFDLLTCMSKLLVLGMPLVDVVRAVTERPAAAIGRSERGTLTVGSPGDAAVLKLKPGRFTYMDVNGEIVEGKERLVSQGIVVGGSWWPNEPAGSAPDLGSFTHHHPEMHADVVARHFGPMHRGDC